MVQITEYRQRTETPAGETRDDTLRSANPVAEAWMGLGAEAGEAGARARNFLEHDAADRAKDEFADRLHKLKWGDPANGHKGLLLMSGEEAEAELATFDDKVAALRSEVEARLPKGHAAYYFRGSAADQEQALRGEVSRFAATNYLTLLEDRSRVRGQNADNAFAMAADEQTRDLKLEEARRETAGQIERAGFAPDSEIGMARAEAGEAARFEAYAQHHSVDEQRQMLLSGKLKLSPARRDIYLKSLEVVAPGKAKDAPFQAPPADVAARLGAPPQNPAAPPHAQPGIPGPAAPAASSAVGAPQTSTWGPLLLDEDGVPLREDVLRRADIIADVRSYTPEMKEAYRKIVESEWAERKRRSDERQEYQIGRIEGEAAAGKTLETMDISLLDGLNPRRLRQAVIAMTHPKSDRDTDRALGKARQLLAAHRTGPFAGLEIMEMVKGLTPESMARHSALKAASTGNAPEFRAAVRTARLVESVGGRGCRELGLHPDSAEALTLVNALDRRVQDEEADTGRRLTLAEASVLWDETVSLALDGLLGAGDDEQQLAEQPGEDWGGARMPQGGLGEDDLPADGGSEAQGQFIDRGLDWRPADGTLDNPDGRGGDGDIILASRGGSARGGAGAGGGVRLPPPPRLSPRPKPPKTTPMRDGRAPPPRDVEVAEYDVGEVIRQFDWTIRYQLTSTSVAAAAQALDKEGRKKAPLESMAGRAGETYGGQMMAYDDRYRTTFASIPLLHDQEPEGYNIMFRTRNGAPEWSLDNKAWHNSLKDKPPYAKGGTYYDEAVMAAQGLGRWGQERLADAGKLAERVAEGAKAGARNASENLESAKRALRGANDPRFRLRQPKD